MLHSGRPLIRLYEKHLLSLGVVTPLEKGVCSFLKKNPLPPSVLDHLTQKNSSQEIKAPYDSLERWRELLANCLMVTFQALPSFFSTDVIGQVKHHRKHQVWKEFQLLNAFQTLSCHLLNEPCGIPSPMLYENGMAPLFSSSIWPWAATPQQTFNAELGVLWSILGSICQNDKLSSAACRLSQWHLNTLNHYFHPFSGLLIPEDDFSLPQLLTVNYLLFHATACFEQNAQMEYVAQRQLEHLENALVNSETRIHPLYILLEEKIARLAEIPSVVKMELPSAIEDKQISLVGIRSPQHSVVCVAAGGNTGLGSFYFHDTQIVSWGPHHYPLDDCSGFGVLTSISSENKIQVLENLNFRQHAKVRLTDKPFLNDSQVIFRMGKMSEIWIDVEQIFHNQKLDINTSWSSLEALKDVSFTFFVKAKFCIVNGVTLLPKTLDRYTGKVGPVILEGDLGNLEIICDKNSGSLQVIPLAGQDNFWGADFLLAYSLESGFDFAWHISPTSSS